MKGLSILFFILLLTSCDTTRSDFMVSHGCFWKVEAFHHNILPIEQTLCAYTAEPNRNPIYENAKINDHIEALKVYKVNILEG